MNPQLDAWRRARRTHSPRTSRRDEKSACIRQTREFGPTAENGRFARARLLGGDGHGELLASLCSPSFEHGPARARLHALAEPVLSESLDPTGLVSSLHSWVSSSSCSSPEATGSGDPQAWLATLNSGLSSGLWSGLWLLDGVDQSNRMCSIWLLLAA
jgi:hypothetical protein